MARHYKIKLEDKAALINKLQKLDVNVDSFDIKDNKVDNTFEFDVEDQKAIDIINTVLRQSPKISKIKEQLRAVVREELKVMRNK
jgi:hypothetical protein